METETDIVESFGNDEVKVGTFLAARSLVGVQGFEVKLTRAKPFRTFEIPIPPPGQAVSGVTATLRYWYLQFDGGDHHVQSGSAGVTSVGFGPNGGAKITVKAGLADHNKDDAWTAVVYGDAYFWA